MGSSSQKSSRGLADGSERGSGQRPEALRKICHFSISFSVIFPTREKDKIGRINLAFKIWKQILMVDCQVFCQSLTIAAIGAKHCKFAAFLFELHCR